METLLYCLFHISVNFENHQYLRCFLDFRDNLGIVRKVHDPSDHFIFNFQILVLNF